MYTVTETWQELRIQLGCNKGSYTPSHILSSCQVSVMAYWAVGSLASPTHLFHPSSWLFCLLIHSWISVTCYKLGQGLRVYWESIFLVRTWLQLMCCATRGLLSSSFGQGAVEHSEVQTRSSRDNQCQFQTEEHTWGSEHISIEEEHVRVMRIGDMSGFGFREQK